MRASEQMRHFLTFRVFLARARAKLDLVDGLEVAKQPQLRSVLSQRCVKTSILPLPQPLNVGDAEIAAKRQQIGSKIKGGTLNLFSEIFNDDIHQREDLGLYATSARPGLCLAETP